MVVERPSNRSRILRTANIEHEADLDVSEENVGWTERVFERDVDVLAQPRDVVLIQFVVGAVEQSRRRRDDVRPAVQPERGCHEQDEEAEMRQRVCHELGGRAAQRTRHLDTTITSTSSWLNTLSLCLLVCCYDWPTVV